MSDQIIPVHILLFSNRESKNILDMYRPQEVDCRVQIRDEMSDKIFYEKIQVGIFQLISEFSKGSKKIMALLTPGLFAV